MGIAFGLLVLVCLVLIVQPVQSVYVVGVVEWSDYGLARIGIVGGGQYVPFVPVKLYGAVGMYCNRGEWIHALLDCTIERLDRAPIVPKEITG